MLILLGAEGSGNMGRTQVSRGAGGAGIWGARRSAEARRASEYGPQAGQQKRGGRRNMGRT